MPNVVVGVSSLSVTTIVLVMMAQACKPSIQGTEAGGLIAVRLAGATQGVLVSFLLL